MDIPIHGASGKTDVQFEKLRGNLRFPVRKGAFFSASVAVVVLMFGYLLWMVTQLRYVFRSLSRRLSFVAENARRIRWVGLAVIFGESEQARAHLGRNVFGEFLIGDRRALDPGISEVNPDLGGALAGAGRSVGTAEFFVRTAPVPGAPHYWIAGGGAACAEFGGTCDACGGATAATAGA